MLASFYLARARMNRGGDEGMRLLRLATGCGCSSTVFIYCIVLDLVPGTRSSTGMCGKIAVGY